MGDKGEEKKKKQKHIWPPGNICFLLNSVSFKKDLLNQTIPNGIF